MMKTFAFAAVAALALTAISQQQANAWFNFGVGGSANLNISWGGCSICKVSENWPTQAYGNPQYNSYGPSCSGPPSYPVTPYGMSTYGGISGGYVAPPPGYVAPPPTPVPPSRGSGTGSGQATGYFDLQPVPTTSFVQPAYYLNMQYYYYPAPAYYYGG